MPITDFHFEKGVFSAKEVGDVDVEDARAWASHLRVCAETSPVPVVALVDASEVGFVSKKAREVFAEASRIPNLRVISVAACDVLSMEAVRTISMRGAPGRTYAFVTLAEAQHFAHMAVDTTVSGR